MSIGTLLAQDFKLAARNYFVVVGLIILAVGVTVYYVLPDSFESENEWFYFDARLTSAAPSTEDAGALPTGASPTGASPAGASPAGLSSPAVLDSREAVRARVAEEEGAVGIIFEQGGHVTLLTASPLSEEQIALTQAAMTGLLAADSVAPRRQGGQAGQAGQAGGGRLPGGAEAYDVVQMQPGAPRLGIDDLLVPVLVAFDVLILGFLFVAVMLFQEKQEGTIWAFRVTPAGAAAYVGAKVGLWVALSVAYGVLLVAATTGYTMSATAWLQYLVVLVLSSLFMTSLGLFVAVFFEGISDWFFVGILILMVNMVPNISFLNPSFSPRWVTEIPSYPAIFAVRDIIFDTGREGFFGEFVLRYLIYNAVSVPLAFLGVRRKLMKEAR